MIEQSSEVARTQLLLADLTAAQRLLADAQHGYRTMDRSKFARGRALWQLLLEVLGLRSGRFVAYSSNRPDSAEPVLAAMRDVTISLDPYQRWLDRYQNADVDAQRMLVKSFPFKPIFSIIVPTYDTPRAMLVACIESVIAQSYPYWELCIADDCSPSPHVREVIEAYRQRDNRIKALFRDVNGHISEASNDAIKLASGEYIGLLDHDDVLAPNALYENALAINQNPSLDMLYSDEDKTDAEGRRFDPFFKPDWSPELFLSKMYTCHFGVYRRSIVEEIGGFRSEFNGSQDYDLVLRVTEKTDRIYHIPKILYSWRVHSGSAAGGVDAKPYAYIAAQKALTQALDRRGEPGRIEHVPGCHGLYIPRFELRRPGKVGIIIPSRDRATDLDRCLRSIFLKSSYRDFEAIVVDNGTKDIEALRVLDQWRNWDKERFRVVSADVPFNFSALVNMGAAQTDAAYLLLLNNDTEVITADWLERMMEEAQRPQIGAVGVKLLYPDDSVQHCGIALGLGGAAGHVNYKRHRYDLNYFGQIVTLANFSAVTAACMMVRHEEFEAVGGFDERFSIAYNDVDFCLRLRERGLRHVYLPHVELFHYESASRGSDLNPERRQRNLEEQEMLIERWNIREVPDPYYNVNLALTHPDYRLAQVPGQRKVFRDLELLREYDETEKVTA